MNILRHPGTLAVLILIVVLLFGARRLPDVAKSVGQSLKIFKSEMKDLRDDDAATTSPTATGPGSTNTGATGPATTNAATTNAATTDAVRPGNSDTPSGPA